MSRRTKVIVVIGSLLLIAAFLGFLLRPMLAMTGKAERMDDAASVRYKPA